MSQAKQNDPFLSKTEAKTQPEETKSRKKSPASTNPEKTQPASGFKPTWLIGGSILIIVLAVLYTQYAGEGGHLKNLHTRETGQARTVVPEVEDDAKGFLYLQELWKNVFHLEKIGQEVKVSSSRCSDLENKSIDETFPELIKGIGEHMNVKDLSLVSPLCKDLTDKGFIQASTNIGKYLPNLTGLSVFVESKPNITDKSIEHLASTIGKNLKNLQQLSLTFFMSPKFTGTAFNHLADAFDQFPRTFKNLSISATGWAKVTDEMVKNLAASVARNFNDLQYLKLSLRGCNSLTKGLVDDVTSAIGKKNKNLETLTLVFGISDLSDDEVKSLGQNIAGLSKLKALTLILMETKVGNDGLEHLGKAIAKNHATLESLTLDFTKSSRVSDDGVKRLSQELKDKLHNLKQISLRFNGLHSLSDEGVKDLSSILNEKLKGLEQLSLVFMLCDKITGVGIIELAKQIEQNLQNLQKLELTFAANKAIKDEAASQIAAIFSPKLHTLRDLTLKMKGSGLTNKGIQEIAANLGENLINLEQLDIDFGMNQAVTDEGVQHLASAVNKRLPKLQDLSLGVGLPSLTNVGASAVAEALSHFNQGLKSLHLSFEASHVTDDAVKQLCFIIGNHLRNLQKLSLSLYMIGELTDKTMMHVEDLVTNNLSNLRQLMFRLYMSRISNSAITNFVASIAEKAPQVSEMQIIYPQQGTPEEQAALKQIAKSIPLMPA